MATSFDLWEKDPFFPAAEEVQESADRMESVYRRWVQERRGGDSKAVTGGWGLAAGELRRELHTALGTAKWQLDELEQAIKSNDEAVLAGKDTRERHDDFVSAIGYRILEVENNLKESNIAEGSGPLSCVHLDKGERDELALFLSASPSHQRDNVVTIPSAGDLEVGNNARVKKDMSVDSSKDSSGSAESGPVRVKEDILYGHRRVASANADIASWTMLIPNEGEGTAERSSGDSHKVPLLKIIRSFALMSTLLSKPRMKYKSGVRKCTSIDQQDVEEPIPLRNSELSQGVDGCFERSKSCLSTCDESTYNKKLYGWLGALRRQLQRSQYQIQYGHPIQLIVLALVVLVICKHFGLIFLSVYCCFEVHCEQFVHINHQPWQRIIGIHAGIALQYIFLHMLSPAGASFKSICFDLMFQTSSFSTLLTFYSSFCNSSYLFVCVCVCVCVVGS